MWGIYGWGVTWVEKAKTPPLLTGFSAVALDRAHIIDYGEKIVAENYISFQS
jgi:hypothetical protein